MREIPPATRNSIQKGKGKGTQSKNPSNQKRSNQPDIVVSKLKARAPPVRKQEINAQPSRAPVRKLGSKLQAGRLPVSPAIHGLKMPGNGTSDSIQKRLKNKSPWYTSIVDPLHGADCKIPDSTGVETGTLQLVERLPLTVTANGLTGFRTTCLHPNHYYLSANASNYQILDGASTIASIGWSTAGTAAFPTQDALQSYARGVRVVSAAVMVQSQASLSSNSGLVTLYNIPINQSNYPNGQPLTDYQNQYKAALIPVNNNEPAIVRWYPLKQDGWAYDSFYETDHTSVTTEGPPLAELGFIISGALAGTLYEVTVVVNYEFVPLRNAVNILDASPSPVDVMETDLVESWVQDMDVGSMTTNRKMATSPSAVEPSHDDDQTGFGMFFNVIAELAPYALALL